LVVLIDHFEAVLLETDHYNCGAFVLLIPNRSRRVLGWHSTEHHRQSHPRSLAIGTLEGNCSVTAMIVHMRADFVPSDKVDAYLEELRRDVLPLYSEAAGFMSVTILRGSS
jgi:hypothetical protein